MRVSNQSVPRTTVLSTRPMKPRQSGRTISIRNAKQYKSFHMPTQSTSNTEAGCCCDAALSRTHYRSACCQVNHHELMQRHQCHIRCECTGTMHTQCTSVWQELIGLPIARCSHRRGADPNTHSASSIPRNPCCADCQKSSAGRYTTYRVSHSMRVTLICTVRSIRGDQTGSNFTDPLDSSLMPSPKDKSVYRHHGGASQYNGISYQV